jgi:hypothetical protein
LYTLTLALSRWERARVRAFGVLAEKFCQSIRGGIVKLKRKKVKQ